MNNDTKTGLKRGIIGLVILVAIAAFLVWVVTAMFGCDTRTATLLGAPDPIDLVDSLVNHGKGWKIQVDSLEGVIDSLETGWADCRRDW